MFLQKNKETPALGNVSTSRPGFIHKCFMLFHYCLTWLHVLESLGVRKTHFPFKFHPKVLQNLSSSLCKTWQQKQNTASTQAAQTFLIKTWRTHDFIRSNDANTCELTVFSFTRFGSILLKEAPSSVFSRASGSAKRVLFFRAWRACWSAEREKTFHPSPDTTAAWRHTGGGQPALLPI